MGGVETLMLALAPIYKSEGYHCEIFFFKHGPMEKYLPVDCTIHFGDLPDLLRLIDSKGFDVVHANSTDWDLGVSAVRNMGAKLVVTAHGWIVPTWTSANCDAFVGCSKWLADDQQPLTDLPAKVVLNGVDVDKFKPNENTAATSPPIVAWVGRGTAVEQKRIDKFAAIAPALRRAGVQIRLVESYGAEKVAKVAPKAARALLPVVDFWRAVHREDMPGFYQEVAASGGCVVSTSSFEGLPMTLLEAQACGCPVIAPDVLGVNECVDPAYGSVLYEFQMQPEQLASLVLETLNDTKQMEWRRKTCVPYVREQFSMKRMAQQYLRIYREAPYSRRKNLANIQARARLSPFLNWGDYVAYRWSPGNDQYEASRKLAELGEWKLASALARTALTTCPTLFVKPKRLTHLIKAVMHPDSSTSRSHTTTCV